MGRICVFCGSRAGNKTIYRQIAQQVGETLARRRIGVVYGAGNTGLMGAVADAALAAGGEVIGVIPDALVAREVAHSNLTQLHIVNSMHERKALMADLSSAFLTLPGGYGTFDELFEMLTWSQLELHSQPKPCGLLNINGYYDYLITMLQHAVEEGFLAPQYCSLLLVENDLENLIDKLVDFSI